jgi:hypothetical protein
MTKNENAFKSKSSENTQANEKETSTVLRGVFFLFPRPAHSTQRHMYSNSSSASKGTAARLGIDEKKLFVLCWNKIEWFTRQATMAKILKSRENAK